MGGEGSKRAKGRAIRLCEREIIGSRRMRDRDRMTERQRVRQGDRESETEGRRFKYGFKEKAR